MQARCDEDGEGRWITMNGTPVYVEPGQTSEEAGKAFAAKKEAERGGGSSSSSNNSELGLVGNVKLNNYLKNNFEKHLPSNVKSIDEFALKFMNKNKPGATRISPSWIYSAHNKGEITYGQMQLLENMTGMELGY